MMDENHDAFEDDDDLLLSQIDLDYLQGTSVQNVFSNACTSDKVDVSKQRADEQYSYACLERIDSDESSIDSESTSKFFSNSKTSPINVNALNSSTISSCDSAMKLKKRRFPGPAGLLPQVNPKDFNLMDKSMKQPSRQTRNDDRTSFSGSLKSADQECSFAAGSASQASPDDCLSQNERQLLERPTWTEIRKHLKVFQDISSSKISSLNISWIRKNVSWLPTSVKIPFLLIIVQQTPDISGRGKHFKTPCIKCIDSTGFVEAAIDYKFASSYADDLVSGTVLALQNVGLLHFKDDQLMIIITERNVICMASALEERDDEEKETLPPNPNTGTSSLRTSLNSKLAHKSVVIVNGVKITHFADFVPDQIVSMYDKLLLATRKNLPTC